MMYYAKGTSNRGREFVAYAGSRNAALHSLADAFTMERAPDETLLTHRITTGKVR